MQKFARLVGFFAVLLVSCQEQSDPTQGLSPEPEEVAAAAQAIHWGYDEADGPCDQRK